MKDIPTKEDWQNKAWYESIEFCHELWQNHYEQKGGRNLYPNPFHQNIQPGDFVTELKNLRYNMRQRGILKAPRKKVETKKVQVSKKNPIY